jgi:cytochrome c
MDSMEVNKGIAAVLVSGIAFFLTGLIGMNLVTENRLEKPAIEIKGIPAEGATAEAAKPAPLPPIGPLLAKADVATGEATAKKLCTSCHTFNEGGKAGVGPNLYGVVGGPHAHMEGFNYTAGLKAKQGPWTFDELNEWLHKPSSYVPGTRMSFAGISNNQTRADVIDYLRSLSKNPEPLPPAQEPQPAAAQPAAQGQPAGQPAAQKPGAQPAGQPGGQPAAQPAGQPAAQKPEAQPAGQPAAQPSAGQPSAAPPSATQSPAKGSEAQPAAKAPEPQPAAK